MSVYYHINFTGVLQHVGLQFRSQRSKQRSRQFRLIQAIYVLIDEQWLTWRIIHYTVPNHRGSSTGQQQEWIPILWKNRMLEFLETIRPDDSMYSLADIDFENNPNYAPLPKPLFTSVEAAGTREAEDMPVEVTAHSALLRHLEQHHPMQAVRRQSLVVDKQQKLQDSPTKSPSKSQPLDGVSYMIVQAMTFISHRLTHAGEFDERVEFCSGRTSCLSDVNTRETIRLT